MKLIDLSTERQRELIDNVSQKKGLSPISIEKDWWVVQVLSALFSLPYSEHLSFKGGTSLSKCWHLIERFSEDIDIAVDRGFLGFGDHLSKNQISDKLRRASCTFTRETLQDGLCESLVSQGIDESKFEVSVNITPVTTTDPETIAIEYSSVYARNAYVVNKVLVEVSGRSMNEPVTHCEIRSIVDDAYPNAVFAQPPTIVTVVKPERTFLEKIFLLHEELAKNENDIRVNRMSRHLYDIVMMCAKGVSESALNDEELYRNVVEHRRKFIGLKGFDYDQLYPATLHIVPTGSAMEMWDDDYKKMRELMIYGKAPAFDEILQSLMQLNKRLSRLPYLPNNKV